MKDFQERVLPGVGTKYSFVTERGELVVAVVHEEGRREVHHFQGEDTEEDRNVLLLTETEADRLGSVMAGAFCRPSPSEKMELALEGVHIEWVNIEKESSLVGRSIGELEIRRRTAVSVVAVIREEEPIVNPGPEFEFAAKDIVVVVGKAESFTAFQEFERGAEGRA